MTEHFRKVRMTPELMATLFTRDALGNRLRVDWGEPDAEGFYVPTVTADLEDNLRFPPGSVFKVPLS